MSKEETIEIDDSVIEVVSAKAAEKAVEALKGEFTYPTAQEIAEKMAELTEKSTKKNVSDVSKEVKSADIKNAIVTRYAEMSKEQRFAKALVAHLNGDSKTLNEYKQYVAHAWVDATQGASDVERANYQNVTTTADGGALVPDPEFMAEVERLTDEYGVASRLAQVRRTANDSVTMLKGTNEISFTKTSEATAQNAQKLTYGAETVALEKYITTLVMTSEVVEDSAIDLFADATNEIARARAKLFDELVFTDATDGLLSAAVSDEYKTLTVGTALTDFTADDAMDAIYTVVSSARRNGRFFMHPTVWNEIRQLKTGDGTNASANYLFGGPGQGVTPSIDGYPVELVDVMPDSGDITADEAFAVFGDLSRVKIHVKRVLETKVFDSGVVKDAGGSDINLITQDSWAMRATLRCKVQTRFQGAFCILGTGTVS